MLKPKQQDEEEYEVNINISLIKPLKSILTINENEEEKLKTTPSNNNQLQEYLLSSVDSTILIRQLPSQGLSFQLWPAAKTLVNLINDYRLQPVTNPLGPTFSRKTDNLRILELGSGTGLVGISAAVILGAKVTVTDLPHVIANLEFNAEANSSAVREHGGSVHVAALRWGEEDDVEVIGREFDVVLASDVVYHDHLYEPLIKTLRLLFEGKSDSEMVFVMGHLKRWKKESVFFKKVRKLFNVDILFKDTPKDGARTGVVVYKFLKKI